MSDGRRGIAYACGAAALFGVTTPLAKLLLADVGPLLLAALLYLGAGLGVAVQRAVGHMRGGAPVGGERRIVLLAILAGGLLAPALQMLGLAHMPAAPAALLLNAESALTVIFARVWFGEHLGRRVSVGLAFVIAGVVLLSQDGDMRLAVGWAPVAVLGACACWAIDNNLTRAAARVDPTWMASAKGFGAGGANLVLAIIVGGSRPGAGTVVAALLLGAFGYGLSLTLFIRALRALGAARTSGYFALAPFVGAAVALLLGGAVPAHFWPGAALVAIGMLLHVTERHVHPHQHQYAGVVQEHEHAHYPDSEHWHDH